MFADRATVAGKWLCGTLCAAVNDDSTAFKNIRCVASSFTPP